MSFQRWMVLLIAAILIPIPCSWADDASTEKVYIVKKGDTLYSISKKLGVRRTDLAAQNVITNPNKIRVGQVLVIPGAAADAPPAPQLKKANAYEEEYAPSPKKMALQSQDSQELPDGQAAENKKKDDKNPHRHLVGGGITGWFAFLDTNVKANSGPIKGTKINLQDDLGVDNFVAIPVVNAWVEPFSWLKLQVEYMGFSIDGRKDINETFTYKGNSYPITDSVRGSADLQRVSGWLEFNPLNGKWGYVGAMVGGEFAHVEAKLSDDIFGSVSDTANNGTVSLGGQAAVYLSKELEIRARGRTFRLNLSNAEFSFVDFQIEGAYTFFNLCELNAGYRALFLDVTHRDAEGDLTLHGPFVGGAIKF